MINRKDYYKHDTEYKIKVDMVEESKNFFKKTVKKKLHEKDYYFLINEIVKFIIYKIKYCLHFLILTRAIDTKFIYYMGFMARNSRKAFTYILCYTLSKYKYYDNVIEPNFKLNDDFNRFVTTEQNTKEDKYGQKYRKQES